MVYYLQLLSECQSLCLLALNTCYQHSCQRWSVKCLKHCWELLLEAHSQHRRWKGLHGAALVQAPYLSVCFPISKGIHTTHFASHMRESPSFPDDVEQLFYIYIYIIFAAYKAMTVQYLMDLKPWDLDCTGQASEHPGKPGLVLKLPICSTTRETGTEAKE